MLKLKVYALIAIVGIIALLATACGQTTPTPTTVPTPSPLPSTSPTPSPAPSPVLSGSLTVYVTDAPPRDEVTSIMVTVSEVQVHKAVAEQEQEQEQAASDNQNQEQEQQQTQQGEGEWISISLSDNATTFDLLEIKGIEQYLGASELDAGKYTQVRLVIDNIQVKLGEGELQDATLPSGELKIVRPFDIVAGEATAIVLDFDADKMVTVTGAGKIMVKPVIKLTVRQEKSKTKGQEDEEELEEEDEEQASVEVSCDDFAGNQHISKEIEVEAGDSFKIALCSNQTTGFQWSESAQIDDETIVEQTDHEFISPEEQQLVGAAGQEVWTFQALQEGTATVKIEYGQPWEGGTKAEWTFTLTLVVE
ncbi:DUF4382 domain-containing protein [Chloroflexota bacterium]